MEILLGEIARRIEGALRGDPRVAIRGVRDLASAREGDLSFLAHPRYRGLLGTTKASAVIVGRDEAEAEIATIRVGDPYLGFCKALSLFHPPFRERPPGVHPTSIVHPSAVVGDGVHVGPLCVVEAGVRLGPRATLCAQVFVGEGSEIGEGSCLYPQVIVREGCRIGARCILHPGVVIGADGFGFAKEGSAHRKIPQIGRVVVEDDVEIGANTTVDRGALGDTRIGRGTKIDNLVQVAHNVTIGEDSILVAQCGVAGSAALGDRVVIAAQAGVAGHIRVGEDAVVGAQAGAIASVPPRKVLLGLPARDRLRTLRIWAGSDRLPEALKTLGVLERRLAALETGARPTRRGKSAAKKVRSKVARRRPAG